MKDPNIVKKVQSKRDNNKITNKVSKTFQLEYNPKNIVSYADRRWSQGNLYKALGFNLNHISSPNYWYIINNCREHRIKFQSISYQSY
jgi:hypothetical protein